MDIPRPRKIGPKNQVVLPPETMAHLGLRVGDEVVITPNPEMPSSYLLVPARVFAGEAFAKALVDLLHNDPSTLEEDPGD